MATDEFDPAAEEVAIKPSGEATTAMRPAFWVAIVGASQALKFLISIVSSVVLGRLLDPSDFGLVATIGPIMALADLFRDLGFTQAVIQRQEITGRQVNALFWLSVVVTTVIVAALTAASPLVAVAFSEPRLTWLMIASSWLLLLGTLNALPIAWLNRNLRFATIAIIESCAAGVSLAAAATTAWLTHSYWSLLVGGGAYTVTAAAMSLATSGWRPGRPVFDRGVRQMARFGAGVSLANFSFFVARNADNLLIAAADGPAPLGYYDRAYKLMLLPISQLTWPVSRVLVPVLSKQLDRPEQYRRTYLDALTCLMLCGQPGLLFCIVFAHPVIHLLLGPKWDAVAPIFAWLGVASLEGLATSSTGWLFISQGRGRDYAKQGLISSAVAMLSFMLGLHWGPLGVAASFTVFDLVTRAPLAWWFATRRGPLGPADALRTITPHLAALVACAACLLLSGELLATPTPFDMVLGVLLTYAAYAAVIAVWPSKRRLLGRLLQNALRRVKRAPKSETTAGG